MLGLALALAAFAAGEDIPVDPQSHGMEGPGRDRRHVRQTLGSVELPIGVVAPGGDRTVAEKGEAEVGSVARFSNRRSLCTARPWCGGIG